LETKIPSVRLLANIRHAFFPQGYRELIAQLLTRQTEVQELMAKAFINGLPAGGGEQTAPPADIPAGSRVLLEIYLLEHLLRPLENRVFNLQWKSLEQR